MSGAASLCSSWAVCFTFDLSPPPGRGAPPHPRLPPLISPQMFDPHKRLELTLDMQKPMVACSFLNDEGDIVAGLGNKVKAEGPSSERG